MFIFEQNIFQNWPDRSVFLTESIRDGGEITGTSFRVKKGTETSKMKMQNSNRAGRKMRLLKKTRTLTKNKTKITLEEQDENNSASEEEIEFADAVLDVV